MLQLIVNDNFNVKLPFKLLKNLCCMNPRLFQLYLIILPMIVCAMTSTAQTTKPPKPAIVIKNGDTSRIEYHSNGKLKTSAVIKKGRKNGLYTSYFPNGNIKERGMMINDHRDGTWKLYEESGILQSAPFYDSDSILAYADINDFTFREYNLDSNKLSINIPATWIAKVNYKWYLINSSKNCPVNTSCPNISVAIDSLDEKSWQEYTEGRLTLVKESGTPTQIMSKRYLLIDKYPAYEIVYKMQEGKRLHADFWVLINVKGKIYSVAATITMNPLVEILKYDGLFREVIASIRIK
jgi:hypothetical protein